jgi:GDP-4-dehydro-6-deoxy-D-mannose reductase
MKVLITGVGGFAGPYVAEALVARGHEAWGAGLEDELAPSHPFGSAPSLYAPWDVLDGPDAARDLLEGDAFGGRPDAVIHLAGQASASRSFEDPLGTSRVNFDGVLHLLEGARRARFTGPLLVAGSSEAYGPLPEARPCDEEQPFRPVSPYGVSKAAADLAVRAWARAYGLRAIVTRSFSHTGAGQSPAFALASWAAQIARFEDEGGEAGGAGSGSGAHALRVGDLTPVRDYSDVRDVARAYVLLVEKGEPGSAYNVGSGTGHTLEALAKALVARAKVPVAIETDPARLRPADVPYLVGDPTRLSRATGWTPSFTIDQTLDSLLEGARAARGDRAPSKGLA